MKIARAIVVLCLAPTLAGCAGVSQVTGLAGLGQIAGTVKPRIVCTLQGRAELLQEGLPGFAVATQLKDADALCAALAVAKQASAP